MSLELEARKKEGASYLDLTQANPSLCGFEYCGHPVFSQLADPQNTLYEPDSKGLLRAREAVTGYYAEKNIRVSPEQIILTSSTSEGYTYLFRLLTEPGSVVLAPTPGYPLFDYLSDLNDVVLKKYPLRYDGAWVLDEEKLAGLGTLGPRTLVWVHPNNPTGHFATVSGRRALIDFSSAHSCPIISDEVFLDYAWDGSVSPQSFASNEKTLTFTLGGVSKMLGLPGMKLAWIAVSGPGDLRREALRRLEIIADTYLSVNTSVQRALPGWIKNRRVAGDEILSRVTQNRTELSRAVSLCPKITLLNAQAGWNGVLRLKISETDEDFCLRLLKEKNVLVHPGYFFDFEDEKHVVLSLLPPKEIFFPAIPRLISAI